MKFLEGILMKFLEGILMKLFERKIRPLFVEKQGYSHWNFITFVIKYSCFVSGEKARL